MKYRINTTSYGILSLRSEIPTSKKAVFLWYNQYKYISLKNIYIKKKFTKSILSILLYAKIYLKSIINFPFNVKLQNIQSLLQQTRNSIIKPKIRLS